MAIVAFGDAATADLYHGVDSARVRRFPVDVRKRALRKLDMINAARSLDDLRRVPGNNLEAMKGDWKDFWSIRVNDQWRVVFRWIGSDAHDVQVVDYH